MPAANCPSKRRSTTFREASVSVSIHEMNLWTSCEKGVRFRQIRNDKASCNRSEDSNARFEAVGIPKTRIGIDWRELGRRLSFGIRVPLSIVMS